MIRPVILSVLALVTCNASLCAQNQKTSDDTDIPLPKAFYHKPGIVISPYKPYNLIDVKHLKPGNAAYDPTTAQIDPKTGKPDISTAKIFIIPAAKKTTTESSGSS